MSRKRKDLPDLDKLPDPYNLQDMVQSPLITKIHHPWRLPLTILTDRQCARCLTTVHFTVLAMKQNIPRRTLEMTGLYSCDYCGIAINLAPADYQANPEDGRDWGFGSTPINLIKYID